MSASVVSPVFIGRKHEMASLAAPLRQAEGGEPAVVQRANLPAIR